MKSVIILGSGRSGTSTVAGLFSRAGYFQGDNYMEARTANPKGFFEDLEVNQINEDILASAYPRIPERIRRILLPAYPFPGARWLSRVRKPDQLSCEPALANRIKSVLQQTPFCLKDPRFSYTLPFWLEHITEPTVLLCVYRHPQQTIESIMRECREFGPLHTLKMNAKIAEEIWYLMYKSILSMHAQVGKEFKFLFIHFEQLFDQTNVKKIQEAVGVPSLHNIAEKAIVRSKDPLKNTIGATTAKVYASLNELSGFTEI
ncbi:hypothetical protein [Catalinimonas alkaloidigena]|nr:hypothetical protein [Catalinimonas alkaloidigena]